MVLVKFINNFIDIKKINDGILYKILIKKDDGISAINNRLFFFKEHCKIFTEKSIDVRYLLFFENSYSDIDEKYINENFTKMENIKVNNILTEYGININQKDKYLFLYLKDVKEDFVLNVYVQ